MFMNKTIIKTFQIELSKNDNSNHPLFYGSYILYLRKNKFKNLLQMIT